MKLQDLRRRVLAVAQEAYRLKLMTMTSGNFSARDPETGLIAITPSGRSYTTMTEADIVLVDRDAKVVDGAHKPSSETPLHVGIYRAKGDVFGISHVHSAHANAVGVLGVTVPPLVGTMWRYIGGDLRTAPHKESGTFEYADHIMGVMKECRAAIMANHGLIAVGPTVEKALESTAYAEEGAQIYLLSRGLGEPSRHPRPEPGSMYAPDWW
ncbi:MAG: class II aldolase/adducin family protein [Chloroflexota bacterium]